MSDSHSAWAVLRGVLYGGPHIAAYNTIDFDVRHAARTEFRFVTYWLVCRTRVAVAMRFVADS